MRPIDADALKIPSEEMIAKMVIDSAPTIDAVVHGEWIEQHENGHGFWVGVCSQCGEENLVDNYCPNCGAKMDKENGIVFAGIRR